VFSQLLSPHFLLLLLEEFFFISPEGKKHSLPKFRCCTSLSLHTRSDSQRILFENHIHARKTFAKSRPTCHPHAIVAPPQLGKRSFPAPARSSSCFQLSVNTTTAQWRIYRVGSKFYKTPLALTVAPTVQYGPLLPSYPP
jgi:hypothetical protein